MQRSPENVPVLSAHVPAVRARLHPDAAVALAALAGVLLLLLLARALEPPTVALVEVPAREGSRIAVEARVVDLVRGERAARLVLADGHHRIPAFAPPDVAVARGDLVRAVGIASRLEEGPGLSLESATVLEPAGTTLLAPRELAASPASYDGARVAVLGEPRGGDLVGVDARLRLSGEPPPLEGGAWVARGTFAYREREAGYVLRVEAWTRPW